MAHYNSKTSSRLASRTGNTDPKWLRVASQIGKLVNDWSWRSDLVVYGGEDSAEGQSVAAYYADISEIEFNIHKCFGHAEPEQVGDLNQVETQREYPMVTGILFHEALHARHTNWNVDYLQEQLADNTEAQVFMLLEESRIEAKGVKERPENKAFLRSSALEMALEDLTEESLSKMSDTWGTAQLAGLALARFDSGVLEASDVNNIHKKVEAVLGAELLADLREIWVEFQSLGVPQVDRGIVLAQRWVELLREADPEGEPQAGDPFAEAEPQEGEGEGEGQGQPSEALQELLYELEDSQQVSQQSAQRDLGEQKQQQDFAEQAKQRAEQAKKRNENKETARQVFDKTNDSRGSGSKSSVRETRQPTGTERASAVHLAKALEKAKYRERSVHIRQTQMPQGKLNIRNAIQNKASEAQGRRGELPAWRQKSRKHTDDPTLSLGVMVDISGSMSSAMEAMGTTAWVLGEAGRRIQADTAMVYYGEGVFPTLRKGQKLSEVTVYSAPDGTEEFGKAWSALDGELGLTTGIGVRMVVIVSDGYYRPDQTQEAQRMLAECRESGVAVLWITPKGAYGSPAEEIIDRIGWGVHLADMDTNQIASVVGSSATKALARVGQAMA